ncbi:MAG: ABC transporter ATP-binding protein [Candidatus Hodarchaeales archaeon]|jgi:putative ABC transport system ATP-binding protein
MVNIQAREIFKIYKSGTLQKNIETVALKGVSLDVNPGDFITVMGPSGSGKTTLLNVIGGLDRPSAGRITYHFTDSLSLDITKLTESQLDDFRHDKIAVIFQIDNLLYHLTALENVELPLKFTGQKNSKNEAEEILVRLGLGERLHHKPFQLSSGERQRVALGSALAYKPFLILADEPTGELDSHTVSEVMSLFKEIQEEESIAFFIVTHNPAVAKYGNRYFKLQDGFLKEQPSAPSFDDFGNIKGEYIVQMDKYHRVAIPYELIGELHPEDRMVSISLNSNKGFTIGKASDVTDESGYLAQLDPENRIMLPKDFRESFPAGTELISTYDSENNQILLKREEEQ